MKKDLKDKGNEGIKYIDSYTHRWSKNDYDTPVPLHISAGKKIDMFFFAEARSNSLLLLLFVFYIKTRYVCTRELCRRKWEHAHLIAVSLATTDRVTASCQGKGSRSHIRRHCRSNAINSIIVRKIEASFFFLLSFNLAWINHISSMNEIEQVPERFHGYSACSLAFNRSYRGVSKILAFVCHTNISL
jgi:hypothetical protein